jgi:uncharacterized protein (DUF362 family)
METKTVVLVEKCAVNEELMIDQFASAIKSISLDKDFVKARAIFIKPNLTYPVYKEGVTTRMEFVRCLVAALRQINSTTKIYIGEGEGGYNSFSMTEAMFNMGFYEIARRFPNVEILNLSATQRVKVQIVAKNKPYELELPELFFKEIDFSVSCPLPKVHCMTKVTLSMKNQWGCLPDTMRLKNHFVFEEIINQVCKQLKFKYAFLDGKVGLTNNGPMNGDPIEVNWFAASNSLGAMDMVISDMMGFDWNKIGHLKFAQKYGFMPDERDIEIIGDKNSLKRKFRLKRNFWNYPALIAFHSKNLTSFFYFSKWATLLHDIMYSIRKRPINF